MQKDQKLVYISLSSLHFIASYEDRIRSMGETSLKKLKNRYSNIDLESNEYIPDVIKEKLKGNQ